jgi:hypothetical protein
MPPQSLDDALAQRFRSDELRAAVNGLRFSEPLAWGEIAEDGTGLRTVTSESVVDGDIALGAFLYDSCADWIFAPVTVRIATRDGLLATTAHGQLGVQHDELGWPAGAAPSFELYARDDLTTARGSLDLMLDPAAVQAADFFMNLQGTPGALYGALRVQVLEFPSEEERIAAQVPLSDTQHATKIFERGAADFPIDHCTPDGQPANAGEPVAVLAGADPGELAEGLRSLLVAEQNVDSSWYVGGLRTRVSFDPGETNPEPDCAGLWWVSFNLNGHVTSDDGHVDDVLTHAVVHVKPYSTTIAQVELDAERAHVTLNAADGTPAMQDGWIDDLDDNDSLAWPPCTHSEPCTP